MLYPIKIISNNYQPTPTLKNNPLFFFFFFFQHLFTY